MTGTSSSRRYQVVLGTIAIGAFLLRVFPFLAGGAWSYRVDYDEGVYFSAASWLLEGALPYRDFVLVHPPGMLVFLSITSAWTRSFLGIDGAFALSRWIAAGLGGLNVLLVARLVLRWAPFVPTGSSRSSRAESRDSLRSKLRGWVGRALDSARAERGLGAIFAAAFYATYPEIVEVERGPFLEPLLNLVCLSLAVAVVEASGSARRDRWLWIAGALGGLAVSIKLWAAIWVLGALWGVSLFAGGRGVLKVLGASLLAFAAVVLPFALQSPTAFLEQVGLFHLWRPPDGLTNRLSRLEQIFALRHLASPLLATAMAAALVVRRGWTVTARVMVCAWALTLVAFFASSGYWSQYNAHLIASEAVLAGALLDRPISRRPLALALLVALLTGLGLSVAHSLKRAASDEQHLALARSALRSVGDCVFTFDPGWSLAAGRLPPKPPQAPLVIDNYGQQLLSAVSGGHRFPNAAAAFASGTEPLPELEQCRYVILGERGRRQLSPALMTRLETTHERLELGSLEVWQRR